MQSVYRNISKIYKNVYKSVYMNIMVKNPPQLGRWNLSYGEEALKKCDMTTEDHCGVCDNMRHEYLSKQYKKK